MPEWLNTEEAANILEYTRPYIGQLVKEGKLVGKRDKPADDRSLQGLRLRVTANSVMDLISKRAKEPDGAYTRGGDTPMTIYGPRDPDEAEMLNAIGRRYFNALARSGMCNFAALEETIERNGLVQRKHGYRLISLDGKEVRNIGAQGWTIIFDALANRGFDARKYVKLPNEITDKETSIEQQTQESMELDRLRYEIRDLRQALRIIAEASLLALRGDLS